MSLTKISLTTTLTRLLISNSKARSIFVNNLAVRYSTHYNSNNFITITMGKNSTTKSPSKKTPTKANLVRGPGGSSFVDCPYCKKRLSPLLNKL